MKSDHYMAELKPFAALFLDLVAWDSSLLSPLFKDLVTLNSLVTTRGLPVIMIDLPDAGKVVDHALSSGWLDLSLLPNAFGRRRWDEQFLLECLFEKVFDDEGRLREDVDPNSVLFLRQVLYLAKKVRKQCSEKATAAEVDAFLKIETATRVPSLHWDEDELLNPEGFDTWKAGSLTFLDGYRHTSDWFSERDTIPKRFLNLFQTVSDIIVSEMPDFDWRVVTPRHGPGAVADARRGSDKYQFPTWPRKLDLTFPAEYFSQSREDMHFGSDDLLAFEGHDDGSVTTHLITKA
jgi:hypothetical protein